MRFDVLWSRSEICMSFTQVANCIRSLGISSSYGLGDGAALESSWRA